MTNVGMIVMSKSFNYFFFYSWDKICLILLTSFFGHLGKLWVPSWRNGGKVLCLASVCNLLRTIFHLFVLLDEQAHTDTDVHSASDTSVSQTVCCLFFFCRHCGAFIFLCVNQVWPMFFGWTCICANKWQKKSFYVCTLKLIFKSQCFPNVIFLWLV